MCGEYDSGEGEGGSIIFMNEVNCKLYEREKGGLVGQAHELIIRCEWMKGAILFVLISTTIDSSISIELALSQC